MSAIRKVQWWLFAVVVVFWLATWAKHELNKFGAMMFHAYSEPYPETSAGAKKEGRWVADFTIEPMSVTGEGTTFEFHEAWLQAVDEPTSTLVWFSAKKRTAWNYLCVRTKSKAEQDVWFSLIPEYQTAFKITGLGSKGIDFTRYSGDFQFQKVPLDLQDLKIKVTAHRIFGNDQREITVGTVQLARK